jgi:hypothetical protein
MRLNNCLPLLKPLAALVFSAAYLVGQMAPVLTVAPQPTVKVAKGGTATITVKASLPAGYHANTNKPTEVYLIPMTLKWTAGPLQAGNIDYPKGTMEKYSFSDKPISVVTGDFSITTTFTVPAGTSTGPAAEVGALRYQACDSKACYPPKTVPINVTVQVE